MQYPQYIACLNLQKKGGVRNNQRIIRKEEEEIT